MRKWTYLVAALLMSGTAATFTSCIDTTEPAGIEALRGAKAELLQAKAQVELAEAQKRLADAEYKKALAAIKQEKAKQEALATALQTEKNAKKIAEIKQQMELSAAQHRQKMAVALAAAEEAEKKYQETLIDIELALLGYKENVYAEELKKLLTTTTFKYTSVTFEFIIKDGQYQYDENGNIQYTEKKEDVDIAGYYSLIQKLSEKRNQLADLNRELINLSLKFDYTDLKKDNQARIDYYQGLIDAETELLAEYKKIGDMDITAWEAEYEALKTKIETAEEAQTAIDDKLANDLLPYQEKQREIDAKYSEVKEYTFSFDKELSNVVAYTLNQFLNSYKLIQNQLGDDAYKIDDKFISYINNEIIKQSVVSEDGYSRVFENGLKLTLNLNEFNIITNSDIYRNIGEAENPNYIQALGLLPTLKIYYDDWTAEESANSELELKKLEINKNDALNAYNQELKVWKPLYDDFIVKAQTYKYNYKAETASEKYDSRNEIIKKLNEYNALTTEEQTDAKVKEYAEYFAKYLKERNELDGWNPVYDATNPDKPVYYKDELANTDAAKQKAAFLAFIAIPDDSDSDSDNNNHNELFGTPELTTDNSESTYSKLIASAKKIWGEKPYEAIVDQVISNEFGTSYTYKLNNNVSAFTNDELIKMVEFDMDEWVKENYDAIYFLTEIYNDNGYSQVDYRFKTTIGDGLANDRFASEYLYNQYAEYKANHSYFGSFITGLETLVEAYNAEIEIINKEYAENANAMAALESTAKQEKAKYEREIDGYEDLMKIMATVIDRDNNNITNENSEATLLQALTTIKNEIVDIEGGVKFEYNKDNNEIVQATPEEGKDYYVYGSLVTNKAWITYYENINKGLDDGTYTVEGMYDGTKASIETAIELVEAEIEALEALYNNATKKKDELLEVITGSATAE